MLLELLGKHERLLKAMALVERMELLSERYAFKRIRKQPR